MNNYTTHKNIIKALAVFAVFVSLFTIIGINTASAACSNNNNQCPPVQGSCRVSVNRAETGDRVTFRTSVSGGNGRYSFYWTGSENLRGTTPNVTKTYNNPGRKTARVEITSAGRTITRTCDVVIEEEQSCSNNNSQCPPVQGSCIASVSRAEIGDTVTFRTSVSGGNGRYSYLWSGSENLRGTAPTISKAYSSAGSKTARVEITSAGRTITRTCNVVIEDEPAVDDLDVVCRAVPSQAEIDELVTFTATATGGAGGYEYDWSGDDGLDGSSRIVTHRYDDEGNYDATVRVTDDEGRTRTATCDVEVEDDAEPEGDLDGRCVGRPSNAEVDERVIWTAYAEDGDGDYDYDWSGTDGLDGDDREITHRYDDEGEKTARVRITSGGETITRTCTIDVDEDEDDNDDEDLDARCVANVSTGIAGQQIRWTVTADGGDGDYDYDWSGTDGLDGDDRTIYKVYDSTGIKEARVRVESDGETETAECDVNIISDAVNPGFIYLNSIPATGISPTLKTALFGAGIVLWSAFLGYIYVARRNEKIKTQAMLAEIEG